MRTGASIKNSVFATMLVIVKILIGFVAQKIFVLILNTEYLGANGLFSNIIMLLSLAELGIGQAIIYNLYKPIANDNKETIKSLMRLYKKAYNWIAITVLIIGVLLIPFLGFFIGDTTLDLNFNLVYILFLLQAVMSYVATYKRSILYAYQENYIVSLIDMSYIFVMNLLQLIMLYVAKNYYLYLGIKVCCVFVENLVITYIANKKYPFINEKNTNKLDKNIEKDIFNRIKAEMLHKVGGIVVNGTDNIIISKFLGLITVGLYSNYYLVIRYIGEIMHQMIIALTPSVGNLLVENDKEHSFKVYKKVRFFNFWLSTFSSVSILVIIQSFIRIWMGEEFLLPLMIVATLVINQYFKSMRASNDIFLSAAGIAVETRFVPIIESILNIVFSIILLKYCGLVGVFFGTLISMIPLWCYSYPKFGYKNLFGGKYFDYAKENITYFVIFVVIAVVTYLTGNMLVINNVWFEIFFKLIICVILPNLILFLIYRKTEEFEYFKELAKNIFKVKKETKTI